MNIKKNSYFLFSTILLGLLCYSPVFAQVTRGVGVRVKNEQTNKVEEVNLYKASYALVIGVSDYTNGWQSLPGVKSDVKAVSSSLKEQNFEVTEVVNPKRAELSAAIEKFINDYGYEYENRLLIYYAGHGHTQKSGAGYEQGFIVPTDAPSPKAGNEIDFRRSAVSMDTIERYAQDINAKHALFVFDSCFSGALITKTRSAIPPIITFKATQPVRQFITAGSDDQEVPDVSVFRQQFVEGIKGAADRNTDGFVTASELADFLQNKVTRYTRGAQTPQYGKIRDARLDKGDFIFALPNRAAILNSDPITSQPSNAIINRATGELSFWNSIENSTDPRDFDDYLTNYPNGSYAATARLKLRKLSELKIEKPVLENNKKLEENSYSNFMDKAEEAIVRRDINGAIEFFEKAGIADGTKIKPFEQLGYIYYERNDFTNAPKAMLKALKNGGRIIFTEVSHSSATGLAASFQSGKIIITKSTITFINDKKNYEADISDLVIERKSGGNFDSGTTMVGGKLREGLNKIIKGTKDDTKMYFQFWGKEPKNKARMFEAILLGLQQ
jgi:hypothetical protein